MNRSKRILNRPYCAELCFAHIYMLNNFKRDMDVKICEIGTMPFWHNAILAYL